MCDAWQASNTDSYFAVTGHWIEEVTKNEWVLKNALFGFTHMNTAHNGKRLGQALYKICQRLDIVKKVCFIMQKIQYLTRSLTWIVQIGHITCDNASNNNTMMTEFAKRYEEEVGKGFNVKHGHIR
jgi:hypothetical protein